MLLHHVKKKAMSTAANEAKAICQYLTVDEQKALCERLIAEMSVTPAGATAGATLSGFGENECEMSHCEQYHTQSGFMPR